MEEPVEKRFATMDVFELADVIRDVSAPISLRYLALDFYAAKLRWPDQLQNPGLPLNRQRPNTRPN